MELRDTKDSLTTVLSDFSHYKSRSTAEISKLTAELAEALNRAQTAENDAAQTKTKLRQATEMAAAATAAQRQAARNAEEVSVAAQQSYRLFISTADRLSGITRELVSYKHILKRVIVSLFVSNYRKKQALRQAHSALVQSTRCMRQELRKEVNASLNAGGGSGHSTTIDPSIELASPQAASAGRRTYEFPGALIRLDSKHTVGDEDATDADLSLVAAPVTAATAGPTKRQSSLLTSFQQQQHHRPRHITLHELVSQVSDLCFGSVPLSVELTRLKAHWQASSDSFFTRTIELKSQIVDLQAELAAERSKSAAQRRRLQGFEEKEAQAREAEASAAADTHPFLQAHSGQQRRHSVIAAAAAAASAAGATGMSSTGTSSVFGSSSFAPPSSGLAATPATANGSAVQSRRSMRGASWGSGHLITNHESSPATNAPPPTNPRRSSAHRSLDASLGVVTPMASATAASGSSTSRDAIVSVHEDQAAEAEATASTTTAATAAASVTPGNRRGSQLSGPKIDTAPIGNSVAQSASAADLLTPSPRSASHAAPVPPVSAQSGSGASGNSSSRRPPRRSPYASPIVAAAASSPSIHASPSNRSIGIDSNVSLPDIDSARKPSTAPLSPRHGHTDKRSGAAEETKQSTATLESIPRRPLIPFRGRGGSGDGGGGGASRRILQQSSADELGAHTARDSGFTIAPHSPSPFVASHSAHGVASSTHGIYSQKQQRNKQAQLLQREREARSRSRSPRKYMISRGKQRLAAHAQQSSQQSSQQQATPLSSADQAASDSVNSQAVGAPA